MRQGGSDVEPTGEEATTIGDRLFRNPWRLGREEKIAWVRGFTAFS